MALALALVLARLQSARRLLRQAKERAMRAEFTEQAVYTKLG